MRVQETKVYQFDELGERAKERAREWYRQVAFDDSRWSESVIEDSTRIAAILGIDISTRTAQLMGGSTRQKTTIYWDLGNGGGAYPRMYFYV